MSLSIILSDGKNRYYESENSIYVSGYVIILLSSVSLLLSITLYGVTLTAKQTKKSRLPPGIIQHLSLNSLCVGVLGFASSLENTSHFKIWINLGSSQMVIYALTVHFIIKLFQNSVFFVFVGNVRNFWAEALKNFPNYRKS